MVRTVASTPVASSRLNWTLPLAVFREAFFGVPTAFTLILPEAVPHSYSSPTVFSTIFPLAAAYFTSPTLPSFTEIFPLAVVTFPEESRAPLTVIFPLAVVNLPFRNSPPLIFTSPLAAFTSELSISASAMLMSPLALVALNSFRLSFERQTSPLETVVLSFGIPLGSFTVSRMA